jgi:signal transduction histidine kinase
MIINNSLIEQMPFPCFIINDDYCILDMSISAAQRFPTSNTFLDLIHYSHQTELQEFLNSSQETNFIELKMTTNNNLVVFMQVYKLISHDGLIHLFCIPNEKYSDEIYNLLNSVRSKITDINSELVSNKQKFAEIKEAAILSDQLSTIGQLAAGIAHEIRNPLTTVKGFIQLIKPHLAEIGKEEYATIALDEISRANDIIYEFLNAAKPKKNNKQMIDVNKLVKDTLILYESEAILRNLEIDTSYNCENGMVYIDSKRIKQVLVNLIKNAIEAIEENHKNEHGRILIKTEIADKKAVIFIQDNGIGMEDEIVEQLFTPFFSTKETGTGIGLSVCKKIIEQHGGKIIVTSQPNLGTTFEIQLPLYEN